MEDINKKVLFQNKEYQLIEETEIFEEENFIYKRLFINKLDKDNIFLPDIYISKEDISNHENKKMIIEISTSSHGYMKASELKKRIEAEQKALFFAESIEYFVNNFKTK